MQYHIKVSDGQIAPYVLLPGDPGRVKVVASYWDECHEVASNREHVTYTGVSKGVPISCTSTGMGCPSTSIALEELARVGAKTFIRIGTCGTFQDNIKNGDLAIFDSAARFDGTTKTYAPVEIPAVADYRVVQAMVEAAEGLGFTYHVGASRTADTFYACHPRPGSSYNNYWNSEWANFFEDLKRMQVIGAEMETSIVLLLARLWNLRAGSVAVVLDNMLTVSGETGSFDPEKDLSHDDKNIEKLALIGCETVRILNSKGL